MSTVTNNWPPHPASGNEEVEARIRMVEEQLVHPADNRRPIKSDKVLEVMRTVPRHAFVPEDYYDQAYADRALPIESGQTISQPYIVALMTEVLDLKPSSKVLEVGTGSGYQAAVLSHFTPHVYSIEILPTLHENTRRVLLEEGYSNVSLLCGDGYLGWEEHAPFDAIIVTCAEQRIPDPLWQQLAPQGKMAIPVEDENSQQQLVLLTKSESGDQKSRSIIPVRFVPMTHYA